MNALSYREYNSTRPASATVYTEEMPRMGGGKIYYLTSATLDRQRNPEKSRPDVLIAASLLAVSGVTMLFNFPVGTVIGMPAFFYLLAASRGH